MQGLKGVIIVATIVAATLRSVAASAITKRPSCAEPLKLGSVRSSRLSASKLRLRELRKPNDFRLTGYGCRDAVA